MRWDYSKFAKYVGIPFKEDATDGNYEGANCWGLYRFICKQEIGLDIPAYTDLFVDANDPHGIKHAVSLAKKDNGWIKVNEPIEYDLVLLRIKGFPWHIGTYIGNQYMINAQRGVESCLERLDGLKWANNVLGYWRYIPYESSFR